MSTLPTTLGMTDTPTTPTSFSPPAPMLIDGATPDRVPGGLPPVPSTHRGDFYPPHPSQRPVPSSSLQSAASVPGGPPAPPVPAPSFMIPAYAFGSQQ